MSGEPEAGDGTSEAGERSARDEFRQQMKARRGDIERQFEASKAQFDQAQEKIKARTGRDLLGATVLGVLLGGLLVLSLLVFKELFIVFGMVMVTFASWELAQALRNGKYFVPRVPTVIAAVVAVPVAYFGGAGGQLLAVLGGTLFVCIWRIIRQADSAAVAQSAGLVRDLAAVVLVQAYVTLLATFAVVLTAADGGQWWTLAFVIVAVTADIGAYAFGLNFGKHKMAPIISPKKTWEGFAGGGAVSILAGVLLSIFMLGNTWWVGLIFGTAIFLTATLGDLAESLIKRDLGIKDMSSWLPGHGGFLDRLDSILPSAAVAFVMFRIFG